MLTEFFNTATSSGTASVTPMFKSGGNYYNMSAALTANTFGVTAVGLINQIVLDAGEGFSTSQSTTGVNVFVSIMEFDGDAPLKTIKLLSLASGNNTLYTCPAGKSAACLTSNLSATTPNNNSASDIKVINYWNNSGGTRSISFFHVPNGGSAGTGNKLLATSPASVSTGAFSNTFPMSAMNAGDFLVVNTDAATATQWAWVTLVEI